MAPPPVKLVAILPSVYEAWTDACVASMRGPLLSNLEVFDNVTRNQGVPAAWNHGVRIMRAREAGWLVLVSAAMRFGPAGGDDFVRHLDDAPREAWAVEAGVQPRHPTHGFGWHLIAFRASTFDRVGVFDENYWPAYYEDNDFGYRIRLATPEWTQGALLWPKVDVDADLAGYAHGLRLGGVYVNAAGVAGYYRRKWGGPPSCEEWAHPFNDPRLAVSWWPAPNRHRQPGT